MVTAGRKGLAVWGTTRWVLYMHLFASPSPVLSGRPVAPLGDSWLARQLAPINVSDRSAYILNIRALLVQRGSVLRYLDSGGRVRRACQLLSWSGSRMSTTVITEFRTGCEFGHFAPFVGSSWQHVTYRNAEGCMMAGSDCIYESPNMI